VSRESFPYMALNERSLVAVQEVRAKQVDPKRLETCEAGRIESEHEDMPTRRRGLDRVIGE
jgi:hypothetical protein